tara:strand:+ start:188 stop:406 length:219 start_codon:yes stop_codon:yes gene_type:complete
VNGWLVFVYFSCFAVIAGAAFAMMWANLMDINRMSMGEGPKRHPEAPDPGDELMYVDLSKEKLERLYNQDKD